MGRCMDYLQKSLLAFNQDFRARAKSPTQSLATSASEIGIQGQPMA
jgi:hypothetical protein